MKRVTQFSLVFVLGVVVGSEYQQWRTHGPAKAEPPSALSRSDPTVLEHAEHHHAPRYQCPMYPEVVSDHPGTCPICGMNLVAVGERAGHEHPTGSSVDTGESASAVVELSAAVIDQLGVRTAKVRRGALERHIETFGIFYPDSRRNLLYQAVPSRVDPAIQTDGEPATARILVFGQVFERDALYVKPGLQALISIPALGSRVWKGTVESVDQHVNQGTRTLNFRIAMDLEGTVIKSGMIARVTVEADPIQDVLLVPRDSLIATRRSKRVIIALGAGRFQPREVTIDDADEDEVIIRSGLKEGDEIVISGQFLLDSEANLDAGLQRLVDVRQEARTAQAGELQK